MIMYNSLLINQKKQWKIEEWRIDWKTKKITIKLVIYLDKIQFINNNKISLKWLINLRLVLLRII